MKHALFLALLGLAASTTAACSTNSQAADPEADWPVFGHDLNHTRANRVETELGVDNVGDLELLWEHEHAECTSTPAIVDGVIYYADWAGKVYAKDVNDGTEIWTTQLDHGISASVAVLEDRIFIGDRGTFMNALDRETGELLWSVSLDDHPSSSVLSSVLAVDARYDDGTTQGILISGVSSGELGTEKEDYTFQGSIVGLAQDDGEELWRVYVSENDETSGAGVSVWSSPSIDTELQYAFIGTGQTYEEPASPFSDSLIAINYVTGEMAWHRQFTPNDVYTLLMDLPQGPDADIGAAPNLFTIDGRDVVGVGDKGAVYGVFDRLDGEEVWTTRLGPGSHLGGVMAPAAYHDDRIYVATNLWPAGFDVTAVFLPMFMDPENTSELLALDATDGSEVWRVPLASPTIGGALYANGVVYNGHTLGLIQAFDAADGTLLWEDKAGFSLASGQVVSNGLLVATWGFSFIGIRDDTPGTKGGLRIYGLPESE